MSQGIEERPIIQLGTDKMILRHVHDEPFTVRFRDRSEQRNKFQPNRKRGLVRYADDFKTNEGTGAGVYDYGRRKKLSFTLGQYTTVFQAKIYTIKT
jgi:hypothetical protein